MQSYFKYKIFFIVLCIVCPPICLLFQFLVGTSCKIKAIISHLTQLCPPYLTAAYSPREKTVAAKWVDLYIPEDVKTDRLARLNEHNRECCLKSNQKYIEREMEVLIEKFERVNGEDGSTNIISGRTRNNKIVHIPYDKDLTGEFINVRITSARTWYLRGEMI